jgi:hypothetical protein
MDSTEKRKPGRPAGSKNKPKGTNNLIVTMER